jgi:hypothetical protein
MRCTKCGSDNPAAKKFCGDCGERLGITCPKCGAENPDGKKFCGDCGATLAVVSDTVPPTQAPAPGPGKTAFGISVADEPAAGEVPEGERKTVTALFADINDVIEASITVLRPFPNEHCQEAPHSK